MTAEEPTPTAGALMPAHYDRILRFLVARVHDVEEAEDLAQETFLRAHLQRASLREEGALLPWLYRIAANLSLDRIRQRARRAPHESELDPDELPLALETPSPLRLAEQSEMSSCVRRHLDGLREPLRAVLLLHDVRGLTGNETAGALGVSLATAKIRLHRARGALRDSLRAGCTFSRDERDVLVCEPTLRDPIRPSPPCHGNPGVYPFRLPDRP